MKSYLKYIDINLSTIGCTGNVPSAGVVKSSNHVRTVETNPEVRIEKPFISLKEVDGEDHYELVVPSVTKGADAIGPMVNVEFEDVRSFEKVKVCKPYLPVDEDGNYIEHDDDTYNTLTREDEIITEQLQKALDEGKDLVLCPGIFFLSKSLIVRHENQVILGLGLATLIAPQDGTPCIKVQPEVEGVRIAGLVLEASLQQESSLSAANNVERRCLLEVGVEDFNDPGNENNPVLLADIFCRVGGSNLVRQNVETDVMIRIHSGNVVGEWYENR